MSTRPDPWGSQPPGTVDIATRTVFIPGSVELTKAHPLTKSSAMRKQPFAGLGPVAVHPLYFGVGPRCCSVILQYMLDGKKMLLLLLL